ncbi:MAG TPA: hypothetical protein VFH78_08795 [Candidatus Thermoplasmatota archaeon]|nr:hypothetical protein [Candidatus Thermoplasmatota archaeon]
MVDVATPEEQLRRALLDLEAAHRDFVRAYGRRDGEAEVAARHADEARSQAARWGALARAAERLGED